jgi:hypothetical protein
MGGHAYCQWAGALGVTDRGRREFQGVTGGPFAARRWRDAVRIVGASPAVAHPRQQDAATVDLGVEIGDGAALQCPEGRTTGRADDPLRRLTECKRERPAAGDVLDVWRAPSLGAVLPFGCGLWGIGAKGQVSTTIQRNDPKE